VLETAVEAATVPALAVVAALGPSLRNTLIAVAVAMATFALLSGGVSLLVVRRRRRR
jgi:hypothetical protein